MAFLPPTPAVTTATLLLFHRDDGSPVSWGQQTRISLGGAMFTDLALAGWLGVGDDGKRLRTGPAGRTGDLLLDEGLRRFAPENGRPLSTVLNRVGRGLDHEVGLYLAARGVVRIETVGLLHHERRPTTSPAPRQALLERLAWVLRGGAPTPVDSAVIGLVRANGLVPRLFDARALGTNRRMLEQRSRQVAAGAGPGVRAVERAIADGNDAAVAAATAAAANTAI